MKAQLARGPQDSANVVQTPQGQPVTHTGAQAPATDGASGLPAGSGPQLDMCVSRAQAQGALSGASGQGPREPLSAALQVCGTISGYEMLRVGRKKC